jgi:hypothetical protein
MIIFLYICTYNYKNIIKMKKKSEKVNYKIEMVETDKATRIYDQTITKFDSLGREIKISPKSNVSFNKPGFKAEFFVETVSVLIGIGKDNTADLIMSKDAWEALKAGDPIDIDTNKQFKEKFL